MSDELDAMLKAMEPDIDGYKKESEKKPQDDNIFHNIENGSNIIRVLPPWNEKGKFAKVVFRHRDIPVTYMDEKTKEEKQGVRSYLCLKTLGETDCPVCKVLEEFNSKTEAASKFNAQDNFYVNALIFDSEGKLMFGNKPKIVRLTWSVYTWIRTQITNPKIGNILHPVTGCDIEITRKKVGERTSYETVRLKESRIAEKNEDVVLILKSLHNLDSVFGGAKNLKDTLVEVSNTLRLVLSSLVESGDGETKLPEKSSVSVAKSEGKLDEKLIDKSSEKPAEKQPMVNTPTNVSEKPTETAKDIVQKPADAKMCFGTGNKPENREAGTGYSFSRCIPCKHETICKKYGAIHNP